MSINVTDLSERLSNNPELITKVLIQLGCPDESIVYHDRQKLITSVRPADESADNSHGLLVYTMSLQYMFTTRRGRGSLYNLIMDMKDCTFPRALEYAAQWTGIETLDIQIIRPFGGFYRRLAHNQHILDTDLPVYDEEDLPDVRSGLSENFLKDGIDLLTQEEFGVRFNHDENAILIPIRNSNGQLVGCKARNNDPKCDFSHRYWAMLPFQKTHVIYGLDHNIPYIIQKNTLVIVEAEKGVMQAWSFGCRICIAVMGHSLSEVQVRIIKALMVKNIVIGFDEGLEESEIIEEAKKLVIDVPMFQNSVSYIYGGMTPGSKDSPTDHGKKEFLRLIKENSKKVGYGKSE